VREIKFKGKRASNGKWVYGAYIPASEDQPIEHIYDLQLDEFVEIKSGTAGQYVELKDKNRVEIYGGDTVRCAHGNCRVEFGKWVSNNRNNDDILGWMVMGEYSAHPLDPQAAYWVIGNTSENPEPLKTATS